MSYRHHEASPFRIVKIIGMGIIGLVTAVIFALLFGYVVMLLWNWLMPRLFHLSTIAYWEGFGLVLLARLIFGSGIHAKSHHHGHHHFHKWHREFGHHDWDDWSGDDWRIKGGWRNWRYYDEWWRSEGKESFEKYLEGRDSNQNNGKKE